jgi:hypothetical protein
MSREYSFPFTEQFIELAGHKGISIMASVVLFTVGPPHVGESIDQWERRADTACSEIMQAIMLAVEARRSVMTSAAEDEVANESRQ